MRVAIVHDWLVGMGGGEKVLEAICELFEGPVYTLIKKGEYPFLANRTIYTSFLQKIPCIDQIYPSFLPFFPKAIERFDFTGYDLILSSSHAVAKGIRTHPNQLHICYCHTPMRYVWDLQEFYLNNLGPFRRGLARPCFSLLRHWDQKTVKRVNHFIANSKYVSKRIETHYSCPSTVIYPPVDTDGFNISQEKESFFVTCCRLVPYKRVDILVEAFSKMPEKTLHIIGDGPNKKKLMSKAPKNVKFLGYLPDQTVREKISKARAFLYAADEEFGIAMGEAQAAGVPVIAYGKGGALEMIRPAQTGIFFKEQTPDSVRDAIVRFEKMEEDFEPEKIRKHALQFSKERFKKDLKIFINNILK